MTLFQIIPKCVLNFCFEAMKVLLHSFLFREINTERHFFFKVTPTIFCNLTITVKGVPGCGNDVVYCGVGRVSSSPTRTYKSVLSLVCN